VRAEATCERNFTRRAETAPGRIPLTDQLKSPFAFLLLIEHKFWGIVFLCPISDQLISPSLSWRLIQSPDLMHSCVQLGVTCDPQRLCVCSKLHASKISHLTCELFSIPQIWFSYLFSFFHPRRPRGRWSGREADKKGEIGASWSLVRTKVYKTGGNSPWEDTFNGLVQEPICVLASDWAQILWHCIFCAQSAISLFHRSFPFCT